MPRSLRSNFFTDFDQTFASLRVDFPLALTARVTRLPTGAFPQRPGHSTWHSLSKTMVARASAVYTGQLGSCVWLGLPVRANAIQALLILSASAAARLSLQEAGLLSLMCRPAPSQMAAHLVGASLVAHAIVLSASTAAVAVAHRAVVRSFMRPPSRDPPPVSPGRFRSFSDCGCPRRRPSRVTPPPKLASGSYCGDLSPPPQAAAPHRGHSRRAVRSADRPNPEPDPRLGS